MFCQNCGLQQEPNKRFCSKCGFQFVPNSNVPKVSTNIPSNQISFNPSRAITNFQTASPGARLGAYFLEVLLAIITLGIGYIVGLATGKTFADRIMGTIVVRRPQVK